MINLELGLERLREYRNLIYIPSQGKAMKVLQAREWAYSGEKGSFAIGVNNQVFETGRVPDEIEAVLPWILRVGGKRELEFLRAPGDLNSCRYSKAIYNQMKGISERMTRSEFRMFVVHQVSDGVLTNSMAGVIITSPLDEDRYINAVESWSGTNIAKHGVNQLRNRVADNKLQVSPLQMISRTSETNFMKRGRALCRDISPLRRA